MTDTTPTVDDIFRALDEPGSTYPRAAVDAAVARRDEMVPRLLVCLEEVLADPAGFAADRPTAFGHMFSLVLLAHFREAKAHEPVLRLAALSPELADPVLGEFATEGIAAVLALTSDGRTDGIAALLANPDAFGYVRAEAANALALLAAWGQADRDEVIALIAAELAPATFTDSDSYHWTGAMCALLDMRAVGHRDTILAAMEAGVVDPMCVFAEEVAPELAGPYDASDVTHRADRRIDDIHEWMSWWVCFNRTGRRIASGKRSGPSSQQAKQKKNKDKDKAARKAAKKARRKGR